ncbi:MAG: AAA family ATPase [Bacteroidaceae bacterium]|nr:AAA family ATPase [Bacteroidaceae bacterium]
MSRIIIKNVGPIKNVDINLKKVNVFIGPQGSGKSTIAKIVSFCTWLEKVNEVTKRAAVDGLIKRLCTFHHMEEYFSDKSVILYLGDNVVFAYNWDENKAIPKRESFGESNVSHFNEKELVLTAIGKVLNPKVVYIPAERNFVSAVPTLKDYSDKNDNLQSFVNDWFEAKRHYTKESPMPVTNLGLDYYYNKGTDRDYLKMAGGREIPLTSASSGFQSVVPLAVLVKWLSCGIYEENKPFSPAENERVRNILAHLSGSTNEMEAELVERLRGFIQGRVYSHTQFIIEEPEQNVFPQTQMDLLYYLISEINHGRDHRLVMTTHSPYLLYALNNCMLAYLVKDKVDEDVAGEIECLPYALNPEDVFVWSLQDGCLRNAKGEIHKTIQDERGLIRKNYFNDVMHRVMDDFNKLLEYDD